jgi:membrane-bound lytic murein transglycosylase B
VRPTIAALATLAYNPRRAAYFRSELFHALEIASRGDIALEKMRGSWAGAMGQPQFMPSSYLAHAQDFDGDGRRDIWNSQADVFASIANYLNAYGWMKDFTWGRQVRVSSAAARKVAAAAPLRDEGCEARRQMSEALPLVKWRSLGVTLANGQPLPSAMVDASLLRTGTRSYLVYPNYEALLSYNCAHTYAMSVALLSERMLTPAPKAPARRKTTRRR